MNGSIKNFLRGHAIVKIDKRWVYQDNVSSTVGSKRACGRCGKMDEDGIDACLGVLPGVINACCGHGIDSEAYIQFENGIIVEGFKIGG